MTAFEIAAMTLSLKVALWALCFSLPPGIAMAWVLSRLQFPGKVLLDAIVHLPLVLPPVIVGYLLLVLFGRQGIIGAWLDQTFGLTLSFSWRGAALAAAVMAFPLLVRAIRLSFDTIDQRLETAARTLGASRLRVFFTISLPLAVPGLLSGAVLAFARCLGEFGATITFAANIPGETQTLPLAVFAVLQNPDGEPAAARLAVISALIALFALAVSQWLSLRQAKRAAM